MFLLAIFIICLVFSPLLGCILGEINSYKVRRAIASIFIFLGVFSLLLFISGYNAEPYAVEDYKLKYNPIYVKDVHETEIKYIYKNKTYLLPVQIDTVNYVDMHIQYRKPHGIFKYFVPGEGIITYHNSTMHLTESEYKYIRTYCKK